ncbi:MFS transporter [Novosphingobium sp.]|uniref:MFS transporter n=1 Tax=Novosphingobium sp. TaxID=1874826 RepID=UPI00260D0C3E|nr:MFS transporter [Novosphingobium sp.]
MSLLFLAQVINYFDKGVIGLAAVPIMRELGLTSEQYGLVASAFFSLYAVSGVLVGFFVAHRVSGKLLLTVMVIIWSLSALPIVIFSSLGVLIAARVVLGIGEGPANATSMSICHEWFSPERRNMPSALLTLGASVGSLAAGPILTHFIVSYGWRAAFLFCSALGAAWLVAWLVWGENGPYSLAASAQTTRSSDEKTEGVNLSQRVIWTDPTIIGSVITGFTAYWGVGFTIAWLAPLLQQGLGFSAEKTGWTTAVVAAVNSILLLAISYGSQRMVLHGVPTRVSRGLVNAGCMITGAAALAIAAIAADPWTKIAFIAIGGALPTLTFTLGPSLVSAIIPTFHRSRIIIMLYAGITSAGLVAPWLAGRIIGTRGIAGFDAALLLNAAVVGLGGLAAALLLQPERTALRLAAAAGDKVLND